MKRIKEGKFTRIWWNYLKTGTPDHHHRITFTEGCDITNTGQSSPQSFAPNFTMVPSYWHANRCPNLLTAVSVQFLAVPFGVCIFSSFGAWRQARPVGFTACVKCAIPASWANLFSVCLNHFILFYVVFGVVLPTRTELFTFVYSHFVFQLDIDS